MLELFTSRLVRNLLLALKFLLVTQAEPFEANHNTAGISMPESELSLLCNAEPLKDTRLVKVIKIFAFLSFCHFFVILCPNTVLGTGGHHSCQITSNSGWQANPGQATRTSKNRVGPRHGCFGRAYHLAPLQTHAL